MYFFTNGRGIRRERRSIVGSVAGNTPALEDSEISSCHPSSNFEFSRIAKAETKEGQKPQMSEHAVRVSSGV